MRIKNLLLTAATAATVLFYISGTNCAQAGEYSSLEEAVKDTALERTYTLTINENVTNNLGEMGGENSTLSIDGGNFTIEGNGHDGITVNYGQTLNVTNATINGFKRTNTEATYNGGFIYNSGTINNIDANFTGNNTLTANNLSDGGAIYNDSSIENIKGLFEGNSANNYGGAIYNGGTIDTIEADFANNHNNGGNYLALGGAIYNSEQSTINSIIGNFTGNYNESINENAEGGAIYNSCYMSIIGEIEGNFTGNYVESTNYAGNGGAICNSCGVINNIKGNFTDNYAKGGDRARGGAFFNYGNIENIESNFINNEANAKKVVFGGAIYFENGNIESIKGDFRGNHAISSGTAHGGAIYNEEANIDSIEGDFIGNYTNGEESCGGALHNFQGHIKNIKGNFSDNYSSGNFSSGGAIYNKYKIDTIEGTFNNNRTIAQENTIGGGICNKNNIESINATFTGNSAKSENGIAIGGAIYNIGKINNLHSDFIENTADCTNGNAEGGAFAFTSSKIIPTYSRNINEIDLGKYYSYDKNEIENENLTIENSTIKGNKATSENGNAKAGAILISDAIILANEKTIRNHSSEENAQKEIEQVQAYIQGSIEAGTFLENFEDIPITKDISIKNSVIENNSAIAGDNARGGAISVGADVPSYLEEDYYGINVYIDDELIGKYYKKGYHSNGSTLTNNIIYDYDVASMQTDLLIENTLFNANSAIAQNSNALGGAIYIDSNIDFSALDNVFADEYESFSSSDFDLDHDAAVEYVKNWIKEGVFGTEYTDDPKTMTFSAKIKDINTTIKNSTFTNNIAKSENGEALGGAIYTDNDIEVIADNGNSVFEGNKTISKGIEDDNAIYLDGAKLTLNAKNNGNIVLKDNVRGANDYSVDITGDTTGNVYLLNDLHNANVTMGNTNINTINNAAHTYQFNSLTLTNDVNVAVDVDLANKTMDRFKADSYGEHKGNINVVGMNLVSDAKSDFTEIEFADAGLKDNVVNKVNSELPDKKYQTTLYTPIYKYKVNYENREDAGVFTFAGGPSGGSSEDFNPSVLAPEVSAQMGAQAVQLNSYNEAFRNMDTFMLMTEAERYAYKNRNKYASLENGIYYDPTMTAYQNNTAWFRPYTTFENVPLKHGPKVRNTAYGSYFGYDSSLHELGKGWDGTFGVYAGYNGSHQSYDGVTVNQNGGQLGLIGVAYKGNFFSGWTVNVGASAGEANTMYGNDNFTMLSTGISTKNGYNLEFADGRIIIQPNVILSYSMVDTFDYTNAAGVRMHSDPLHNVQIEPGVKFIGNIGTWQPYAGVSVVWDILNKSKFMANNVELPKLSVKPYVKYGVGLQKRWDDKFTAYGQAFATNGGRNGVGLQAGFRMALGHETLKPRAAWLKDDKNDVIVINGKK